MIADTDEEDVFTVKIFFGLFAHLLVDGEYISLGAMAGSLE